MIEFLLGLLGIAVVVAMLAQINFIAAGSRNPVNPIVGHTRMVVDTRNELADVLAGDSSGKYELEYLADWEVGPDGARNTADDRSTQGNAGSFLSTLGAAIRPDDLYGQLQTKSFDGNSTVYFSGGSSGSMGESFGIFYVEGQTTIPNSLAVQRLVTGSATLVLEHNIYMPQVDSLGDASGVDF